MMECPKCGKSHTEWHGNETCFSCATDKISNGIRETIEFIKIKQSDNTLRGE